MNMKKNLTKVIVNNSKKIAMNVGKLTGTAIVIAYVTPKSKEVGKETIELISQQVRLIRNITMGK